MQFFLFYPQEILFASVASRHVFTCQQLGIILMHLKYTSEREALAALLAPQIVDAENAVCHLLPLLLERTTVSDRGY
ncbi:hypothetical protein GBAR_LOCUS16930 [Geodia barretti]|uniref:DUF4476 domain-containing protein n=1 Tax=Geodia barretti TaxID=519541 RepID=A0AA35SH09_GEOBA|nr:hypothetical protein GBAR_LOCUS16930 [Geodia barretti]